MTATVEIASEATLDFTKIEVLTDNDKTHVNTHFFKAKFELISFKYTILYHPQ